MSLVLFDVWNCITPIEIFWEFLKVVTIIYANTVCAHNVAYTLSSNASLLHEILTCLFSFQTAPLSATSLWAAAPSAWTETPPPPSPWPASGAARPTTASAAREWGWGCATASTIYAMEQRRKAQLYSSLSSLWWRPYYWRRGSEKGQFLDWQ